MGEEISTLIEEEEKTINKILKNERNTEDNISTNGSMLDFCISRDKKNEPKVELKRRSSNPRPRIISSVSVSKPPSSSRSRYRRSKSYAGVGSGGVVSLSQCPLCGRQFEKSVIESHAAQCAGLYDDDTGQGTCDPSRVTCNMCGQKFGQENILQHSRYCGEVVV